MAHQSSQVRAFVTRYTPEPEVKPENKTEEKKEDEAQLETPSYKQHGEHIRVGLPCTWQQPGKPDTSSRLDGRDRPTKSREKICTKTISTFF